MTTHIEKTAREKLRSVAASAVVQKQLGLDRLKSKSAIDESIEAVAEEFRQLASQDGGAQQLYDAVARTDASVAERFLHERGRESALLDASTQLQVIVGSRGREKLVDRMVNRAGVTYLQANDSLAFASSNLIDALSEGHASGSVSNDADGTVALLSRPAGQPVYASRSYTSSAAGYTSGGAAVADSEKSWVLRYALPLVLLAALLLSTLKFCSEAEKSRVVTEERSLLQKELAGAQQQTQTANSRLLALQSDYDSAQGDMAELASNLEASEKELAALRDVPTDTVELQQLLQSVSQERDRAVEIKTQTDKQLEKITADLDETSRQQQILQADLDAARATITANDSAISDLNSRITSLIAERDETVVKFNDASDALSNEKALRSEEVAQFGDNVNALESSLDRSQSVQAEQKEQIASLTKEIARLEAELTDTGAKLESERSERTSDTERLSLQASGLQNELKQSVGLYKSAEQRLVEQESELAIRAARIEEQRQQIQQLEQRSALAADATGKLERQLQELESDYKAAQLAIGDRDESLSGNEQALADSNAQLTAAREELQTLIGANEGLQKEIDALTTENSDQLAKITRRDERYTELLAELEDTESGYSEAQRLKEELENKLRETSEQLNQVNAENQQTRNDLKRADSKVEALAAQTSSLEDELSSLNEQAGQMTRDLDTATAANEELSNAIDQLQQENKELRQQYDRQRTQSLQKSTESLQKIAVLEQSLTDSKKEIRQFGVELNLVQTDLDQLTAKEREQIEGVQTLRDDIRQALSEAGVDEVEVTTIDDDRAVALRLGSSSVFQTGDVALSRGGVAVLNKIGNVIGEYPDWHLDVEGHTDSLPIGEKLRVRYPSNWELSSARASAVINYLLLAGKVRPDAISARGFAETRPVADNNNFHGRVANRRVDLVLRPR